MDRYCRHELPEVQKDIPMPRKVLDGRSFPKGRKVPESPWVEFLKSLDVGDSFVVSNRTCNYVKTKAKEQDIDLVWERLEGFETRFWIYGKAGNRNPVYRMVVKEDMEVVS